MNNRILIVTSNYYKDISENLSRGSIDFLKQKNYEYEIVLAPGCFEIPYLIKKNINNYTGFIALGCVIRGETYHFEIIANECGRAIIDLSLQYNKPIGFGILTCETYKQAIIRSDILQKNKGREAAIACINLLENDLNIK